MYQGETITTTITCLPVPVAQIKSLYIVFLKSRVPILEKTLEDCTIDDETISFKLTQEESLKLAEGEIIRSLIIITKDGCRLESCPSPFVCKRTVKDVML